MDIDVFRTRSNTGARTEWSSSVNVQARWIPIQGDSNVVIALERPGASADEGIYAGRVELGGHRSSSSSGRTSPSTLASLENGFPFKWPVVWRKIRLGRYTSPRHFNC